MNKLACLLLAASACAAQPKTKADDDPAPTGDARAAQLPDFSLDTLDGETFTLSDHVGREVIVMSFWATWCQPCLVELPHLEALYQEEKDNGLLVVAVSMDEPTSQAEVAPTARRLGLTIPVVLDTDQLAVRLYNRQRSAPMTVVIDKRGKIVRASPGYQPGDEVALAEEVRALLKQ